MLSIDHNKIRTAKMGRNVCRSSRSIAGRMIRSAPWLLGSAVLFLRSSSSSATAAAVLAPSGGGGGGICSIASESWSEHPRPSWTILDEGVTPTFQDEVEAEVAASAAIVPPSVGTIDPVPADTDAAATAISNSSLYSYGGDSSDIVAGAPSHEASATPSPAAIRPVEFNRHLLVRMGVTVDGKSDGGGWAVTLDEVLFAHRHDGNNNNNDGRQLVRMERRVWPAEDSASTSSTSFLVPLESLHRRAMAGEADADMMTVVREAVLRASLVELLPSGRRVAMVRLVPVPMAADGRSILSPVVGVHLSGTASPAEPVDDVGKGGPAVPSWDSRMATLPAAAVGLGAAVVVVGIALCFVYLRPARVDEYEYQYQQEQEELLHGNAHYMRHPGGAEPVEEAEMAAEEYYGGGGLDRPIINGALANHDGNYGQEYGGAGGPHGMTPPKVDRKVTAIDQVGAVLSTPVRTPVKEQPIAGAYRETPTPSGSSPVQNGEAGEEPMMSQADDYGNEQKPPAMEQQPLPEQHDANIGVDDDDDVALPESGGLDIEQSQQSRDSSSGGDAQEEHVASGRTSWGLTLGQRSFCSDSSAASVASASSIATHLHANWKQSQSQKGPAPTTENAAAPRSRTSNAASSPTPTRSTSSSIAAEAGNMTTVGDAAAAAVERQEARQPRRRPRQLPSQNAPLFVEKRSPKHRKVEVKPLPNVGASKLLKREERKWDDSRYKFGANGGVGGGSLSSKDRSQTASNKAPSVSKSDSSKSSSRLKRKAAMPLASISVPSDANAKKQRKST